MTKLLLHESKIKSYEAEIKAQSFIVSVSNFSTFGSVLYATFMRESHASESMLCRVYFIIIFDRNRVLCRIATYLLSVTVTQR